MLLAEGTSAERRARLEWEGETPEQLQAEARREQVEWVLAHGGYQCQHCEYVGHNDEICHGTHGERLCYLCAGCLDVDEDKG